MSQHPKWETEPGTGCHIWTGARSPEGYGRIKFKGRNQYVHRLRYEKEVGPIPDRARLIFTCGGGKRGCCNPEHLDAQVPAGVRLFGGGE